MNVKRGIVGRREEVTGGAVGRVNCQIALGRVFRGSMPPDAPWVPEIVRKRLACDYLTVVDATQRARIATYGAPRVTESIVEVPVTRTVTIS